MSFDPLQLLKENTHLKLQVSDLKKSINLMAASESDPSHGQDVSIAGLNLLLLRLGEDGKIQYANTAFSKEFNIEKDDLYNNGIDVLKRILSSELYHRPFSDPKQNKPLFTKYGNILEKPGRSDPLYKKISMTLFFKT
tara:strand:+ start:653 stop:1066 length:414 start_codon:yes stop_codon:yes gene_type:complete